MKTSSKFFLRSAMAAGIFIAGEARGTLADYQGAVQNEASLISYYTFDGGNAQDSKAANHGTAAGTVSYGVGAGGGADKALILKGAGHLNLGQVDAFDFASGQGTIEAWIRADWKSNPGYNPAIFTDRDMGTVNWSLHMNSGKDGVGLWNGATYLPLACPLAGTNWHHFAAVFDVNSDTGISTFTEYWDGQLLGVNEQGLGPSPEAPTELGSSSVSGQEEWIGALDEVAFYSDALSASAIGAHYTAFLSGTAPVITIQPVGGAFLAGIPLTLTVETKGTSVTYAWFKDGSALTGATNDTLVFPQFSAANTGAYQVIAANPGGRATSAVARVELGERPANLKSYQNAVRSEASLLAYYTFDSLDEQDSQASHHGRVQGRVGFGDGIGGGAGKALVLEGAGHVNLGEVAAFSFPSGKGTVEGWLRADWTNAPGYNPVIFANRDMAAAVWSIHMNSGKDAAGLWNGSTYDQQPLIGVGAAWHHLAAVFDTDETGNPFFTLYWDGAPAGTSTQGLGTGGTLPIQLGSSSVTGLERWIGALDEIAFYGDALSAGTIQAHYAAFVSGSAPEVTSQPAGGGYLLGESLILSVGAQGLNLAYQWYKNGVAIEGAQTNTLVFSALAAADSATYRVRVSNPSGPVDSANAIVKVIVPDLAGYQKAVLAEAGLISYYTFDAGDATDAKAAHNGVPVDTVNYQTGIGRAADKALVIDGAGHVDLGVVSDFDFAAGKGAVEAWVRADWTGSPGYNPTIIAERDDAAVNWSLHMNSGKDAAGLWNGATYQALTTSNPGVSWHHLAAVFDVDDTGANVFTFYWDGQPAGETHQKPTGVTELPTELGSASQLGLERWIGALDEVAFYRVALSANTVLSHYQTLFGAAAPSPGLAYVRSGSQITLTWPADATGFVLESAEGLPSTTWTTVSGVANNSITVNATQGATFFRLRKP